MKKKGLLIALLTIVIAGGAIAGTVAFFTDTKTQENVFTMGNVNIDLTEPKFEADTNNTLKLENVMPGDLIDKDPTITVKDGSSESYIRAKVSYAGITDEKTINELESNLLLTAGWAKGTDGYFYFNNKVKAGDKTTVFTKVTIPGTWDEETVKGELKITVTAEAIQADNFNPTITDGKISSWGAVTIK